MIDSSIFRVKVDLGQFYSDHKSKAYVSVNCQWKNVRQFHRHITEIFDVKKFVLLTNDGVYLPAKEHIGIIQSGDVIHVMPKHDDNESVVSATSETLATLTERNVNKHLYANDGQTFKIPSSVSPSIEIISSKKSNIPVGDDECIESVGTNDTGDSTGSKRKRVRHRKKKKNPMENDENQMNLPNVKGASGGILKRDVSAKKTFDKPLPKSNTHVRFEDDESLSELDEEIVLPKIARVIHANVIGVTKMDTKSAVEMEEIRVLKNGIEIDAPSEPTQNLPEALSLDDNELNVKDKPVEATGTALEQLAKDLNAIDKYNDMKNDVKEMDMIAFKVFTPSFEKSDFVIGLVESIIGRNFPNQQDYDLILQILVSTFAGVTEHKNK